MMAFINALSNFSREHLDAVASLLGVGLVLAFIEVRLRALFARHEVREERMHATATMLADSAAATAREAARHIEEIRLEATAARIDIANLGELVKMHDGRLGAIEERLMRAALMVPRPHREEP